MRRVLLLNITYEPLTTVGLHRAVCLVLGEKAEVVHDDSQGAVLRSASVILATPSVIRLRRYIRVPHRSRVPLTRAALMRRDNYLCAYCGTKAETIDHVIPRSRGSRRSRTSIADSSRRSASATRSGLRPSGTFVHRDFEIHRGSTLAALSWQLWIAGVEPLPHPLLGQVEGTERASLKFAATRSQ